LLDGRPFRLEREGERDREIEKMSESEREWTVETVAGGADRRAVVVGGGRLCYERERESTNDKIGSFY
jgi:hypothetical protein